jgi:methionyl-tRNA formyltransferase
LKIIFAGTPPFAAHALAALIEQQFEVLAVLTQPDRPSGRGMQLKPSAVKQLALQHNLTVLQPASLKSAEIQQQLLDLKADVMVVAAYGLILPLAVLQTPRFGCLNIHASILPRWRGAAPIQRAILAGDAETGVTIMQMDVGLDTGDMLLKKTCPIRPQDTAETLHDTLATLGASGILEVLRQLENAQLTPVAQDNQLATYAAKLSKEEAQLDWTRPAAELERAIRGYQPFPVASTHFNGTPLKIWQASVDTGSGASGTVLALDKNTLLVACGEGALRLEILQKPNGKALPVSAFLQGFSLQVGDQLGSK